jgi:hypothetical protein
MPEGAYLADREEKLSDVATHLTSRSAEPLRNETTTHS